MSYSVLMTPTLFKGNVSSMNIAILRAAIKQTLSCLAIAPRLLLVHVDCWGLQGHRSYIGRFDTRDFQKNRREGNIDVTTPVLCYYSRDFSCILQENLKDLESSVETWSQRVRSASHAAHACVLVSFK